MYLKTQPGEAVPLTVALFDGATDQYPQAKLYNTSGSLVTTQNLSHVAGGLYQVSYTPDGSEQSLDVHYIIYSNSGHTSENTTYMRTFDRLYVNYDYRTSQQAFGEATVSAQISKVDIDEIVKRVKEELKISQILTELAKKSEFDVSRDIVKTGIKIPNNRSILEAVSGLKKALPKDAKVIDNSGRFNRLETLLKKPFKNNNLPIIKELKQLKSIILSNKDKDIEKSLKPLLEPLENMLDSLNIQNHSRIEGLKNEIRALKNSMIPFLAGISMTKQRDIDDKFTTILETLETK